MRSIRAISLAVACLCICQSSGFTGSTIQSNRCVASVNNNVRGPAMSAAKWFHHAEEEIEVAIPEVIVDDELDLRRPSRSQSISHGNHHLWRITKVAVPLAALAVFTVPSASNAVVALADIGAITGGAAASYSSWIESLKDSGFYQAFSLVFLSEIGDKTFFVAALLAAKLSRVISFVGSLGALAVMTIISVVIGQVFHAVPSELSNGLPLDDVAAVIAFTYFGVKILSEAFEEDEGKSAMDEEFEEAQEVVQENDMTNSNAGAQIASIFGLVFAAEFGDRSFLATIALSAAQNPVSVAAGGIAAHGIATGIAVIGGAYISKYVSEKVIAIIGGTLFIIFAITTAVGIF